MSPARDDLAARALAVNNSVVGGLARRPATYADLQRHPPNMIRPDWTGEATSRASGRHNRVRKLPIYAAAGGRQVRIVDPGAKTLERFRLDGEASRLVSTHGGDDKVDGEPFDAIELELDALWMR